MFDKENKKLSHYYGVFVWVIIILLGLILMVLVFKVGMMVGFSKSSFSSWGKDYTHKDYNELMKKKFSSIKKSAYSSYKGVTKLTESGFVAIDAYGKEQVVVITDETKIIKGKDTAVKVSVGDKVYVDGNADKNGQVVAEMIKILEPKAEEYKKFLK